MKRVLLTGASGFIGRQCVPALVARDFEVHSVSSRKPSSRDGAGSNRWHQADLLDPKQVTGLVQEVQPSHLLHCAWYAEPGKYWTATENFAWVEASRHLFRTFAAAGGKRVVGVGTCAEYDWSSDVFSEASTPLAPTTTYGICKRDLANDLSEIGRQAGLSTAWGRLFFIYGPHEDPRRLVASVINSLLQDEPALCSHGKQVRDFLYVRDVGDALVALLDSEVTGAVNIASGVPIRLREVIEETARQLNKPGLLRIGHRPVSANEPERLVADVARLRNEVGWTPRFNLAQGLAETINWWRAQLKK